MIGITLTIAVVASVLVVTLRLRYALAVYLTSVLWYPSYLVISIGTIDMPVSRIVVAVLLLRCLCDSRIRSKFTWSRLDTWVALSMFVYVVTYCVTRPLSSAIENRGGFLMDTWFAYMAVRLCLTNYDGFITVVKCIAIVLAPLAILGVLESSGVWAPFRSWLSPLVEGLKTRAPRWGFIRAKGPFGQPIMFGTNFVIFLSLIYYLRHHRNHWRVLAYIFSGMALVGTLCSLSSGPYVMLIVVILCLVLEKHKYLVKPLIIFFVFSCAFIGIASNRSFYHVIASYANPLGGAGWHRAALIDVAIKHFDQWWLIGCGDKDPGWGLYFGMSGTDITNEFILAGVRYGILGVIVLCGVLATAFCGLVRSHKKVIDPKLKSLYWSLGSVLAAIAVAFMSVSFFGPPKVLFYCILGMVGALHSFAENAQQSHKPVRM